MAEIELEHFGKKGMKWGVRRSPKPGASEDAQRTTAYKKTAKRGGTKALSTKELQDLVTRMNLEQQYSRLAKGNSAVTKGKDTANSILSVGNTVNQAVQFANSPAGKILRQQLVKQVAKRVSG
jgi:hypothetical protein